MYGDAPHISQLRVSWISPDLVLERWTADLFVAGIGPIGPIDLPFTYNVEQNVEIRVRPLAATTNANRVLATLCDLPVSNHLYHATYLPILDQSGNAAIPNWVVAVTIFTGSISFIDPTTNVITTCTTTGVPVARPRWATVIQYTGGESGGAVLFHY